MIELVNANSIAIPLASQSVHLIITSPPYFGLRAYGAGDGEIGAEPTPEEFIAALAAVGRECKRVLRDDGVMIINLGTSYSSGVSTRWYNIREDLTEDERAYVYLEMFGVRINGYETESEGIVLTVLQEAVLSGEGGKRPELEIKGIKKELSEAQGEIQEKRPASKEGTSPGGSSRAWWGVCLLRRGHLRVSNRGSHQWGWGKAPKGKVRVIAYIRTGNTVGHKKAGVPSRQVSGTLLQLQLRKRRVGYLSTRKIPKELIPDNLIEYFTPAHQYQVGDNMNIPHRVASALQADGWLWRDTVIWRKKSAMPESVNGTRWERCRVKVANARGWYDWQDCPGCDKCRDTDGLVLRRGSWRTTSAHEYIFVFAKGMGYFADREAVKQGDKVYTRKAGGYGDEHIRPGRNVTRNEGGLADRDTTTVGANPRDVMTFKPTPFKGAHYATFPTTLPEFFIRAYTSEAGVCGECGAPWARVVGDRSVEFTSGSGRAGNPPKGKNNGFEQATSGDYDVRMGPVTHTPTLGFRRTCEHAAPAVPATILDPFNGSGSTLIAARQLGRSGIGLDLNLRYILDVARERLGLNAVRAWANGKAKGGETKVEDLPMFVQEVTP